MTLPTLIRNGTVVTAEETKPADILIENGRISEVRHNIPAPPGQTPCPGESQARI